MLCLQTALVLEHAVVAAGIGFRIACRDCNQHWFQNCVLFAISIGFRTCCLQPALVSEHAVCSRHWFQNRLFSTSTGFRTACCVCSRHWFQNRQFPAGIGFRTGCLQPALDLEQAVCSRHWFQRGCLQPALDLEQAVCSRHWI